MDTLRVLQQIQSEIEADKAQGLQKGKTLGLHQLKIIIDKKMLSKG